MARISQTELKQATTHQVRADQKVKDLSAKPDIVYYTIFGKHTGLDEDSNPTVSSEKGAYAKQMRRGSTYDYFVMVGNSGRLYNPNGLFSSREADKTSLSRGRPELRFIKTNYAVFNYYLSFLKSKNLAWLKNAEREM